MKGMNRKLFLLFLANQIKYTSKKNLKLCNKELFKLLKIRMDTLYFHYYIKITELSCNYEECVRDLRNLKYPTDEKKTITDYFEIKMHYLICKKKKKDIETKKLRENFCHMMAYGIDFIMEHIIKNK